MIEQEPSDEDVIHIVGYIFVGAVAIYFAFHVVDAVWDALAWAVGK